VNVPKLDNPARTYRPDCDGIRSLAILSVVLYHAGVPLLSGGFTGVDVFFVISGYLIGGHIFFDLLTDNFSFVQFYRRRAKRILPAFFLVLISTITVALFLLSPYELSELVKSGFAAAISASNVYFWRYTDYFAPNSDLNPLLMTWSLGVEEQFYILIPISMVLLARIRRGLLLSSIVAVCGLSFAYAVYEVARSPLGAFYMLPGRAWELGFGVTLAVMELKSSRALLSKPLAQWTSTAGIALVLAPLVFISISTPFPGVAALPSALGTALIIASPEGWINRRLLSLPPLVFIGKISYSWYLWHWPMLSFLHVMHDGKLPPSVAALSVAMSFCAAVVSYYLVEQPFRKSDMAAAPLLARYATVSVAVMVVCAGIWWSHGLPQRYPLLAVADREIDAMKYNPCLISSRGSTPNLSKVCYDASDTKTTVALWGDSHSAAMAPGLRDQVKAEQYGFAQLGQTGCLPLIDAAEYRADNPDVARHCMEFNRNVVAILNASHNIRVVVLVAFWERPFQPDSEVWLVGEHAEGNGRPSLQQQERMFVSSLKTSIQCLQASGKQVVLMDDVPSFAFDPHSLFRNCQMPVRHRIAEWLGEHHGCEVGSGPMRDPASAALTTSLLHEGASGDPSISLVDLKQDMCDKAGQCSYRQNGQELYIDAVHLSVAGAHYVLRDFRLSPIIAMKE